MAEILTADDLLQLHEVKSHLRVQHRDDDQLLDTYIKAATLNLAQFLRRPVTDGTMRERFAPGCVELALENTAVDPVTLTYLDLEGVDQSIPDPIIRNMRGVSHIRVVDDEWPEALEFSVVYGVQAPPVAHPLMVAALMHVAFVYNNPQGVCDDIKDALPVGYKALIAPYRRY